MSQVLSMPSYLNKVDTSILAEELGDIDASIYRAPDGYEFNLYKVGNPSAEKLVILPPYGMSYLLLSRLVKVLSGKYYVLSWESRGCPDYEASVSDDRFDLVSQSEDFVNILKQEGFDSFHYVGWCQAAQLLVHTLSVSDLQPKTISWIAPAGLGTSLVKSEFERCALPIYLEIEKLGSAYAEKLAMILDKYRDQPIREEIAAEKYTVLHLSDPDATHRFSRYMKLYEDNKSKVIELLGQVFEKHHVYVIHCKDDTYSHFSEAVQLEKKYPNVELELMPGGGHLQLFYEPDVIAGLILGYINREAELAGEVVA
ncbi:alpha/beta hydrolase [Endozoicomonas sp. SM1973]|uniref:Alpha/beta hydrolase n=1 Tax=Spartinivicinus marinus TaxID=2994442 RepID=A0A853I967_9GAMM|nr:alpha/beta hydrolase [Spartinivicinus marinus]MCX4030253.1 alpha/beta hydrolase [Spartinivicinus marinus]NYZ69409.1 alpha/beta hydrolase [Spartinivicinus marinus]